MLLFLQQNPIVVDLAKQPEASPDISINVVIGAFATAGAFLALAAIGSGLVAGGIFFYKRWRDASAPAAQSQHTHTSLRI
jgi:hypothetical protein